MASKKALGCLVLSAALLIEPSGLATAKQRTSPEQASQPSGRAAIPARNVSQAALQHDQLRIRDPQLRATLQSSLTGLSVDDILAMAEAIEREPGGQAAREIEGQQEGLDRPVSRTEINALKNLAPRPATEIAPGSAGPQAGAIRAPVSASPAQQIRPRERPAGQRQVGVPPGGLSPGGLPPAPSGPASLAAPPQPYLDVNGFGEDLHNALRNSVQGYTMRMRRNGQNIYTLQWNWARRPAEASRGWTPNRRMNIASVSKFITAVAMVDLLQRRNIDPQTSIANWLPNYWNMGPNANRITFEMLMTHSSGLNNSGSTAFGTMRQMVASGVTANLPTTFTYENTNFGLQRILIATLGGYVDRNLNMGTTGMNDTIWDSVTRAAYADYVAKNVFAPAGVANASFDKTGNTALAYGVQGGNAWNSGNLSWRAGSGGWHLSADEVLNIAATYRYSGKIVPTGVASSSIGNLYGFDGRWNTATGFVYHKNGSWQQLADCPANQRQEQSLFLLMPGNMEMVLLVNSPVGPNCTFLRGVVQQIYLDNIITPDN